MNRIFAITTRGLESISAEELSALPGVTIRQNAYRRVTAECAESLAPLLGLRTVDDVYIELADWRDVGHTRDTLSALRKYATQLELTSATDAIATLRPIPKEPNFSVTASFVGRRNYNTDEIKRAVAEDIMETWLWRYTADDRTADLNVRVFIEHETAHIGLRLSKHPLHERSYKVVERAGSLKPPVAAAMLRMAGVQPRDMLLDPCCGTGTILIEAALTGAQTLGGDIDAQAVEAARTNARAARFDLRASRWDARTLPLPDASVDHVVTNLPWGRQIAVDEALADFYAAVCAEAERVLRPGGRVVMLTNAPDLLRFSALELHTSIEISLFGQNPTISVFQSESHG